MAFAYPTNVQAPLTEVIKIISELPTSLWKMKKNVNFLYHMLFRTYLKIVPHVIHLKNDCAKTFFAYPAAEATCGLRAGAGAKHHIQLSYLCSIRLLS